MPAEPLLEVRGLCAGYGDTEVLRGIDLTVDAGEIVAVVRRVRDRGVTVLLIEHVMQAVMSLAEHVYVLNQGRMIAEGPPLHVARLPQVVEAYLGHGAAVRLGAQAVEIAT